MGEGCPVDTLKWHRLFCTKRDATARQASKLRTSAEDLMNAAVRVKLVERGTHRLDLPADNFAGGPEQAGLHALKVQPALIASDAQLSRL